MEKRRIRKRAKIYKEGITGGEKKVAATSKRMEIRKRDEQIKRKKKRDV